MALPNGPYPTGELDFWVRNGASGVFILSRDGKNIDVLGTAAGSLKSTILEQLESKREDWFSFYYATSPARLFSIECEWYHIFNPTNYAEHPRPTQSSSLLKCPVAGCDFNR